MLICIVDMPTAKKLKYTQYIPVIYMVKPDENVPFVS